MNLKIRDEVYTERYRLQTKKEIAGINRYVGRQQIGAHRSVYRPNYYMSPQGKLVYYT